MHTIKMITLGLALLMVCLVLGRSGKSPRATAMAALAFVPLWLIIAATNTYIVAANAGSSLTDEMPVFLLVLALPALGAYVLWRKLR
jgi:uncharacterized membrane protein YadS